MERRRVDLAAGRGRLQDFRRRLQAIAFHGGEKRSADDETTGGVEEKGAAFHEIKVVKG